LLALLELGVDSAPYLHAVEWEYGGSMSDLARMVTAGLASIQPERHQTQDWMRFQRIKCMPADLQLAMFREHTTSADRQTQFLAFQELVHMGDHGLPTLIEHLRTGDSIQKRRACESLRDMAPEGAREALRSALSDQDPKVRQNAVRALIRIGRKDDRGVLRGMRQDVSCAVRQTVMEKEGCDD
jgi:hypothetical protein